ncbi:MAG: hypothetical protein H0W54_07210 [Rubrobacter sp.]|nr:hypothetical protein [Rubrobacter sp.]
MVEGDREYAYLTIPAAGEFRACAGLILAGMAVRAKVGVGALEESVEVLESFHTGDTPTTYRFSLEADGVVAEVEKDNSEWNTVVELVS